MQASFRVILLLGAAGAGGCTYRLPAERLDRPADASRGPPPAYYDAGGPVPAPTARWVQARRPAYVVERVLLPARVPAALSHVPRADDPIDVLHVRPRRGAPGRRPLILMSPILSGSTLLVDRFAEDFARAGYHAAIVQRKELEFDPEASLEMAEAETRLVVMRSRQALDWLVTLPDVDSERLGTFGISAGAIVSAMLAGADPRLRTHVWVLAGGPLVDVMMDTSEGRFQEYGRKTRAATGLSQAEIRRRLRASLRTDPVALAGRVPRDGVLLVLARQDRSVPYRYGLRLWEALGRPARAETPFGHYTTFLVLPWLEQLALDHFRRRMPVDGSD